MAFQTIRSRVPLKFWFVLMIIVVTAAILATLHFAGIWDLSFIGIWFLGYFTWASQDIVSGIIAIVIPIALGLFCGYAIHKYLVGFKTAAPLTQQQPTYTPTNAPIPVTQPKVVEG